MNPTRVKGHYGRLILLLAGFVLGKVSFKLLTSADVTPIHLTGSVVALLSVLAISIYLLIKEPYDEKQGVIQIQKWAYPLVGMSISDLIAIT